jgi:hypothetical protein
MNPFDLFKPYSPEIHGEFEAYLRGHNGRDGTDNLFGGLKYFFVIRDKGLMIPFATMVRVNLSPIPDIAYFVNPDFMLQSHGRAHSNMSCENAEKGVYDPRKVLRRKAWSISGLDLRKLDSLE